MDRDKRFEKKTAKSDAKAVRLRRIRKGDTRTARLREENDEKLFGERDVK